MVWDFARSTRWIVRHVLVVVLVVVMVNLGFWQLRRLDEKQAYKSLVEAREQQAALPVEDVVPIEADVDADAVDDVLYRRVTATGRYLAEDTVVVENRTYNGASGGWVLTPLDLGDGTAVVVNRGFIGFDAEGRIVAPDPPTSEVRVEGLLFPSQERGSFGPRDPEEGDLAVLARVDLERIAQQVQPRLYPAYVQLVESDPDEPAPAEGSASLVALGPPEPSEGPHLAYAVQWFIFSTIAAGGYVLLLRKVAQDEAKARAQASS
ncbi:MAG TPA: SURF1 family protein [Acidimicrobiales bacterium]|nr:SURF1 family protein [Acidimicrobiales bacterium]